MYYPINEETARRGWDCIHMSEYKEGSATAEYRYCVDEAAAIAEAQKARVSRFFHARIDSLLDAYSRRMAEWTNARNANHAKYPSQFICGAGNFNMRKHNAQMDREDTLWKEYDEIKKLLDRIRATGTGPVDLLDPDARGQLEAQLQKAQETQQYMKDVNAYFRKHKNLDAFPELKVSSFAMDLYAVPFPAYELTSIREKIKRIQARISDLDKLEAAQDAPAEGIPFDGGRILENAAENRLQIIFDAIPSEDIRQKLKYNGFRWSPKNQAWQRQLTSNAMYSARQILSI